MSELPGGMFGYLEGNTTALMDNMGFFQKPRDFRGADDESIGSSDECCKTGSNDQ